MTPMEGDLRFETVPRWLAQADRLISDGELDLSRVGQCDSAGVALLLELHRRAHSQGITLTMRGVPEQLGTLLHFFNIDSVLSLATR